MKYSGLILDCDGVIVDSETWSCHAWNVLFTRQYNIDIGTDYHSILGKSTKDTIHYYFDKYHLPLSVALETRLGELKESIYYELARGQLQPIPGILDFIHQARGQHMSIAVASSGTRQKVEFNLEQVDLLADLPIIVGIEDVRHGKPAPDLFLKAAELLNLPPTSCMVIEDSVSGIRAAKMMGALAIAITTTYSRAQLKEADMIIDNYIDLDLTHLLEM